MMKFDEITTNQWQNMILVLVYIAVGLHQQIRTVTTLNIHIYLTKYTLYQIMYPTKSYRPWWHKYFILWYIFVW
jgi:hypothetical protein